MTQDSDQSFNGFNAYVAGLVTALGLAVLWNFSLAQEFIYRWQTLISGSVATLAAVATVRAIHSQIVQTEQLAKEASIRRNFAARALIAHPLSEICEMQRQIATELANIRNTQIQNQVFNDDYKGPTFKLEGINQLAACIEDADERAAKDISEIISCLQIQQARLNSMSANRNGPKELVFDANVIEHGLDTVSIYARAQRLLLYARRQDDEYFGTPFSDIIRNNCHFITVELNIEERIGARMATIGNDWLGR